jgi:hypothetical protein
MRQIVIQRAPLMRTKTGAYKSLLEAKIMSKPTCSFKILTKKTSRRGKGDAFSFSVFPPPISCNFYCFKVGIVFCQKNVDLF